MDKNTIKEYLLKYSTEEWVREEGFKSKDDFYGFKNVVKEQLGVFAE